MFTLKPFLKSTPKGAQGLSPAYTDPFSGFLTVSPCLDVSGACSPWHFRNPYPVSHRLEAFPRQILWYTDTNLFASLNPVPSPTFAPEGFPFEGCGLGFYPADVPLLPFLKVSAGSFLRSPLLFPKSLSKYKTSKCFTADSPVPSSAVTGFYGI